MKTRNDFRLPLGHVERSSVGFGNTWDKIDKEYFKSAKILAEELGKNKITVVYGGGELGLMGEVAKTALKSGSKVISVIPDFFKTRFKQVTECIIVKTMHERKLIMNEKSEASIALPGGIGTLE